MTDVVERHKKQLSAMRAFLDGRGYFKAAEALEIVHSTEEGLRKDGYTPKLHHQLSVTRLVATLLPHLVFPEETLTAAFLHDLLEDHGTEWSQKNLEERFGQRVALAVWTLTKKSNGLVKSPVLYYDELGHCPIGSIVKLADRAYNLQSMHGVFSPEKQRSYVQEVHNLFFPMIRIARRKFPQQYPAYENLRILLRCQTTLIGHTLDASGTTP